jgi:sarcosine oxidase subunit delta
VAHGAADRLSVVRYASGERISLWRRSAHRRPSDPASRDDAAWAEFLYLRSNPKGVHAERWRHIHGCGRFFNCVRDTVSDRISATYRPGETPPR